MTVAKDMLDWGRFLKTPSKCIATHPDSLWFFENLAISPGQRSCLSGSYVILQEERNAGVNFFVQVILESDSEKKLMKDREVEV